jgi:uncharacterized protein YjbI with pentapeptide repeats
MSSILKLRSPLLFAALGVVATLVLAIVVVKVLLRTGGDTALSDNAALIGAVVALGGVFTAQLVSIALEDQRTNETNRLEGQRASRALELEERRAGEAALQNYFEQVGELLIEKPLREASPEDNLSTVVRAQTLAVLQGLDPDRKRILLLFLYESGLINMAKPVVSLVLADLTGANLHQTRLSKANMNHADLSNANLDYAFLDGANLHWTNLGRAELNGARLHGADLSKTFLREAKLRGAKLRDADLRDADLRDADLSDADLSGANLSGATGITNEQLEQEAASLEGATMPDGSKHP